MEDSSNQQQSTPPSKSRPNATTMIFLFVLAIAMVMMFFTMRGPKRSAISYSFFYSQLLAGNISQVEIEGQ